jgi:hypothetical protein
MTGIRGNGSPSPNIKWEWVIAGTIFFILGGLAIQYSSSTSAIFGASCCILSGTSSILRIGIGSLFHSVDDETLYKLSFYLFLIALAVLGVALGLFVHH